MSYRLLHPLGLGLLGITLAAPATGFDFFDGRLEVHGYYEQQIRAIARDFDTADDFDLTQWWHVLNIEMEASIAPDGWGPFDIVEGFARLEVRYDCVWTGGCGVFPSAKTFGDSADRIPKRLSDARRAGLRSSGTVFNGDQRAFRDIAREFLGYEFHRFDPTNTDPGLDGIPGTQDDLSLTGIVRSPGPDGMVGTADDILFPLSPNGSRKQSAFWTIQGLDTLFDTAGENGIFGDFDDSAPFYFDRQLRQCQFTFRKTGGSMGGLGTQILPWNPGCDIQPLAALASKPNPISPTDPTPLLAAGFSAGSALPARPVPTNPGTVDLGGGNIAPNPLISGAEAQGVYFPNAGLVRTLSEFDAYDQNFREAELQWNRGASQQDEKELKEAFLDLELFDSRLWLRVGKQQIVWGKTELFRNQDQWNPQDLALASLPSLEESRIALWALRGVWSFYDVGPLEDVRLELAATYDQFEPVDLGRCGEPYTPNPVCNKTLGLFIHGLTGFGIAGEVRPPDPWNGFEGIEIGARVEWRYDRYSFALTEYYGYTDFPYQDQIFRYSRNVDPATGRPRRTMSTGSCTGDAFGGSRGIPATTPTEDSCLTASNALAEHSTNQQLFHMICATSIGLLSLDTSACGQTLFNSRNSILTRLPADPRTDPTVTGLASNLIVGNSVAAAVASTGLAMGAPFPLVPLNQDPCDGRLADCTTLADGPGEVNEANPFYSGAGAFATMNNLLTSEQKALLGCGEFYGSNCEVDGIDLLNAEASVLMQSFPGIEGSFGIFSLGWDTSDGSVDQPGTLGFAGGPIGTRGAEILPGARGGGDPANVFDNDPGYDPRVDGCSGPETGFSDCVGKARLQHPYAGAGADRMIGTLDDDPSQYQFFPNELAAASFNAVMALAGLSLANDTARPTVLEFDPANPYREDGCSFLRPNYCGTVQSIFQVTGVQRNTVRAAGERNGLGRRDFVWQGGQDLALRYHKRNILGLSMDFAEDVTKSSWSLEFTWQDDLFFTDNDEADGLQGGVDTYNLTISIDRPTFVNFLNANRTFFFNTQLFTQYVAGYEKGFTTNGPWNFLWVFIVQTGYFDDRLLPRMTMVYDFGSNSGAFIPQTTYRFSSDFSATFGVALFAGREQSRPMPITPTSLSNRAGPGAYTDSVENGLSAIRDRDELFLRIRYSF